MRIALRSLAITIACASIGASPQSSAEPSQEPSISAIEAQRFYVPNNGPQETKLVKPGEEIFRRPIQWAAAARLANDVEFTTSGGNVVIRAGTALPAMILQGLPGSPGPTTAYCTHVPIVRQKGWGLIGALGHNIAYSLQDGRKCLWDSDGDGAADRAFLLDDGTSADRTPRAISPASLNVGEMVNVGPGDYVAIEARKGSRPSFRIIIYQNGKHMNFDSISSSEGREYRFQYVAKNATYPFQTRIYGAQFEIQSFDAKTGTMTISLPEARPSLRIPVPSEVQIQLGYY